MSGRLTHVGRSCRELAVGEGFRPGFTPSSGAFFVPIFVPTLSPAISRPGVTALCAGQARDLVALPRLGLRVRLAVRGGHPRFQ